MVASGGAGNAVWWAVAEQISPQIGTAMAMLEAGWPAASHGGPAAELRLLDQVFGELGDPAAAFRKVDVAIGLMMHGAAAGAGVVVGAASANPAAGILTAAQIEFLYAMAAMLTQAGIADVFPHDAGLGASMKALHARLQALMALGAAGDATLNARIDDLEQQQLELAKERVRADVDYRILAEHVRANPYHYAQAVWSGLDDAQLANLLQEQGVNPSAVDLAITGFFGDRVALRITDEQWALHHGWELGRVHEIERELLEREPRRQELDLPTRGVVVEPGLGACDATEPFVEEHRKIDVRRAEAETRVLEERARQEASESERYERRVGDKLLDPPEGEGAAVVTVNVGGHDDKDLGPAPQQ